MVCTQHPLGGSGVNAGVSTAYTSSTETRTFGHLLALNAPALPAGVVGALSIADPGRWGDGTVAISCDGYRHPLDGRDPATDSGVYTIDLGNGDQDVYCDMVLDGGGWTRVMQVRGDTENTNAVNAAALLDASTGTGAFSKLSDADIRTLATNGALEYQMAREANDSIYVLRASALEWSSFSSVGWTNVRYDSKASNGTWVNDTCNGHFNNRGFSSISDSPTQWGGCSTVFFGVPDYMAQNHTSGGAPGNPFFVYVR